MRMSACATPGGGNARHSRGWFALAAVLIGLFALNVGLRMLFIKQEVAIWRVGDVGEFLLVLAAMASFVAGLLCIQEPPASSASPTRINLEEENHETDQR